MVLFLYQRKVLNPDSHFERDVIILWSNEDVCLHYVWIMCEGRKEIERESSGQAFIILKFAKMTLVGGKKRSVAFQELLRTVSFKCAPHPEQPMEAPSTSSCTFLTEALMITDNTQRCIRQRSRCRLVSLILAEPDCLSCRVVRWCCFRDKAFRVPGFKWRKLSNSPVYSLESVLFTRINFWIRSPLHHICGLV